VALSKDNRIVHGLWIGETLGKMELLTLRSFVRYGHEFHLWLYDDIATPLPAGVVVQDASEIIPRKAVFQRAETDFETGVGKGSYGAPFSDLFRYKLLYEKGGYWADMDVTCLRPLSRLYPERSNSVRKPSLRHEWLFASQSPRSEKDCFYPHRIEGRMSDRRRDAASTQPTDRHRRPLRRGRSSATVRPAPNPQPSSRR
jgi:hypothetical protein